MPRRLFVACLALCGLMNTPALAGVLPERVDQAAQERIAAEAYRSLVIAVQDGDKSEISVYGKLADGKTPDGDTVYEIGSITKTFTATILAQAVLAGRVTLDTPVSRLLPDFDIPSRNGVSITLGNLATQHSGLPRLAINMQPGDPANPYADYDVAKLKTFLKEYALPRDPGAAYEYSNLGFGVLGQALAENAHESYPALIEENILKPLKMRMTATTFTPAMRGHIASGYDEWGKAVKNWDFDALAGAGALRSTANDLLRYLRANMGIDRSSLRGAMKRAQSPTAEVNRTARIGMAWMTTDKGIVWHNGATGGYRSFIGFTADGHRGVVVLTNMATDVDDVGFATLDDDFPLAAAHKAISLPADELDAYVGTYRLPDLLLVKVSHIGDGLMVQAAGRAPFLLFPSATNEFFARVARITISFTRDAQGAVNGLVFHQGSDHVAPKLTAAELPPLPKEVAMDVKSLSAYAAKFRFEGGAMLDVVLANDHLEARLGAQASYPIFASAKDRFFYKVVDAQLEFTRAADGSIAGVVLHQNGVDLPASRIAPP